MTSPDDLLLLFDSVRTRYGTLLIDFEEDDRYVRGDFGAGIIPDSLDDPGFKDAVILPTVADAIDNATDHILSFPAITVPERPVDEGKEEARALAEEKRKFLDMWWDRVFVDQGDPLGRGKRSLIKLIIF